MNCGTQAVPTPHNASIMAKVGYTFSPPILPIAYLTADVVQDFFVSPDPALATESGQSME